MEIFIFFIIIYICFFIKNKHSNYIGKCGERKVAKLLSTLPKNEYKIINDVIIQKDDYSSQIDHIVVSIYGIFVIETKNYKGWIIGNYNYEYWTQNIYGNKYKLYNPIKQNLSHIIALKKYLKLPTNFFISIIAFSNHANLKTNAKNVVYISQVKKVIQQYQEKKLSLNEMQKITELIKNINITNSKTKNIHTTKIKNIIRNKNILEQQGLCPKCGHELILREGRYGIFWGCSNYPNCNYTKHL